MSTEPLIDPVEMRDLLTEVLAGLGYAGFLRFYGRAFEDNEQVSAVPTDYPVFAVPAKITRITVPGTTGTIGSDQITGQLIFCSAGGLPDTIPLRPDTNWKFVDNHGDESGIYVASPIRLGQGGLPLIYNLDVAA